MRMQWPSITSTVYYQLYSRTAEDVSKVAFDPTEPSIGRLEKIRICPPLRWASIKRCIAKTESKPIYAYGDLFADISAERAMGNAAFYASVADGTAGSTKENPMVLVQPERGRGLMNRPFKRIKSSKMSFAESQWGDYLDLQVGAEGFTDGFRLKVGGDDLCGCSSGGEYGSDILQISSQVMDLLPT
ncbi:hypothetical protein DFH06DRAFT_1128640 [Mycena polygramma]|nr:hypothetical protein DFH06DRAFT_1128640 [Mycena polygramma]